MHGYSGSLQFVLYPESVMQQKSKFNRILASGSTKQRHMDNQAMDIENRPLQELTLGDLLPYFRKIISEEVRTKPTHIPLKFSGINNDITEKILQDPERFTFGMAGLAEVLHCSIKTAYNYRSTGEYDPAIIKFGKRVIIDKVKATEIAQAQGITRTSKSKAV